MKVGQCQVLGNSVTPTVTQSKKGPMDRRGPKSCGAHDRCEGRHVRMGGAFGGH